MLRKFECRSQAIWGFTTYSIRFRCTATDADQKLSKTILIWRILQSHRWLLLNGDSCHKGKNSTTLISPIASWTMSKSSNQNEGNIKNYFQICHIQSQTKTTKKISTQNCLFPWFTSSNVKISAKKFNLYCRIWSKRRKTKFISPHRFVSHSIIDSNFRVFFTMTKLFCFDFSYHSYFLQNLFSPRELIENIQTLSPTFIIWLLLLYFSSIFFKFLKVQLTFSIQGPFNFWILFKFLWFWNEWQMGALIDLLNQILVIS